MNRLSIRWRLTLWYGAVVMAILAAFSAAVYLLLAHHLLALTDAALAEELADLAGDIGRCASVAEIPGELGLRYSSHEGYEFQVLDESGRILFRSDGLGPSGIPGPDAGRHPADPDFATLAVEGLGHARLAVRDAPGPDGPTTVQAAVSLAPNDKALGELLIVLALAGPLALVGALGGGYLLARKALAPVDRMTATAAAITARRLNRRLDVSGPDDEIGRLARTFNDMISRLERSFDEVRRFTADAAHELRTPLAAMRTAAEVALRGPRSAERDARVLEDLLEEIERLSRLVSNLLYLAREDAGLTLGRKAPVPLHDLARDVAGHMQAMAQEKEVALVVGGCEPCVVRGDADRLRQLFFNILDNAIKYTPAGGAVRVEGDVRDGRAVYRVTDTGPGIDPRHLPHICKRFFRVDPARSAGDGTGLGLAICQAIAEAHGGTLVIDSAPGRGTAALLSLPRLGPDEP